MRHCLIKCSNRCTGETDTVTMSGLAFNSRSWASITLFLLLSLWEDDFLSEIYMYVTMEWFIEIFVFYKIWFQFLLQKKLTRLLVHVTSTFNSLAFIKSGGIPSPTRTLFTFLSQIKQTYEDAKTLLISQHIQNRYSRRRKLQVLLFRVALRWALLDWWIWSNFEVTFQVHEFIFNSFKKHYIHRNDEIM